MKLLIFYSITYYYKIRMKLLRNGFFRLITIT